MKTRRTFDIVERLMEYNPNQVVLSVKRNGKWDDFSGKDFQEYRDDFSLGLLAMGYQKGDKIVTISNNRPEWNFVDMGMSQIGAVHVPVYPNIGVLEYNYILEHSDARMVIAAQQMHYEKIIDSVKQTPNIERIYSFDELEGVNNWMEIIKLGREHRKDLMPQLEKIRNEIDPEELVSIIYTSGTTGRSKGVMLNHRNFMSNVEACDKIMPLLAGDKYLSFLPLCHVLERMVSYLVLYKGSSIYYAESIDTLGDNIKEVLPHAFTAVPRVLEKLYDKIIIKGKELKGIKRNLFFWAVNLGLKYELDGKNSFFYKIQHKLADILIFSKWRAALGGNIKMLVSGGAPLQERLARSFNGAGIRVLEGYGLTETSPVIAVNYLGKGNMKFGSVGPILNNVEVKIAEDGEICMKGPNQMLGYYKDEERTKEVIDEQGWFHTGDIGKIDENNFLTITDRKKEIFKLSTGKYVAPQILENRAKESQFIDQILIVGEGERYAAAIISPAFDYLHSWCAIKNIKFTDNIELVKKLRVNKRYQKEVDKINADLGKSLQIQKWTLTSRAWTTETGELSATLKLRRNFLRDLYTVQLDKLYGYTEETGNIQLRKDIKAQGKKEVSDIADQELN